jgi:hypothetical protein
MTKRTTWPMRVDDGTKKVGTATVRDERVTATNWAARQLEKKTGVRPPDAFDEIADGDPFYIPPSTPRKHQATVARATVKKPAKYRNTKCEHAGIKFASQKERSHWFHLIQLQAAGQIRDLRLQVPFVIAPAAVVGGKKKGPRKYIADFVYCDAAGELVVVDVKGFLTPMYGFKKHLMKTVHGIDIKEIK